MLVSLLTVFCTVADVVLLYVVFPSYVRLKLYVVIVVGAFLVNVTSPLLFVVAVASSMLLFRYSFIVAFGMGVLPSVSLPVMLNASLYIIAGTLIVSVGDFLVTYTDILALHSACVDVCWNIAVMECVPCVMLGIVAVYAPLVVVVTVVISVELSNILTCCPAPVLNVPDTVILSPTYALFCPFIVIEVGILVIVTVILFDSMSPIFAYNWCVPTVNVDSWKFTSPLLFVVPVLN